MISVFQASFRNSTVDHINMSRFWIKAYKPLPHTDDLSPDEKPQFSDTEQDQHQQYTQILAFKPIWENASGIVMFFIIFTFLNLLLFSVSVTILLRTHSLTADQSQSDLRYFNSSINQDLKKVSSYCEPPVILCFLLEQPLIP